MDTQTLLATYSTLKSDRSSWDSWWEKLRHYVLPRRVASSGHSFVRPQETPSQPLEQLYDTTAIDACQKLASGHISYITPGHEVWFRWAAPVEWSENDAVESWFARASEIAFRELSQSNFYTEIHEVFLDRSALGTGSLFCGLNQEGGLYFSHIPCGSFACAENEEGRVDTYYREFIFTPYQAERQFGREKLGERARAILDNPALRYSGSLRFLHVVHPREVGTYDPKKKDGANRPFRSVYVSLDDNEIVEEEGYFDFPYLVTRFLKWGEGPYGLPPGRLVFPAIVQVQFLNRILDTLGEIAAFPRILELAGQVGEVDLRAGGRTVISPEAAQLGYPREWATNGNYAVGLERLRSKQEAIAQGFYLPMFELWGSTKQAMTATEVMARENEKALLFSPSFTLFINDFQLMMKRIFGLLFRQGKFPTPPPEILQEMRRGEGRFLEPKIIYQSKMALILRRLQAESVDRSLERLAGVMSHHPEAAQNFRWDTIIRETSRAEGMPEHFLAPFSQVETLRQSGSLVSDSSSENEINSWRGLEDWTLPSFLSEEEALSPLAGGVFSPEESSGPASGFSSLFSSPQAKENASSYLTLLSSHES